VATAYCNMIRATVRSLQMKEMSVAIQERYEHRRRLRLPRKDKPPSSSRPRPQAQRSNCRPTHPRTRWVQARIGRGNIDLGRQGVPLRKEGSMEETANVWTVFITDGHPERVSPLYPVFHSETQPRKKCYKVRNTVKNTLKSPVSD
jgi:hypothetical protein